mmetsp:Transcript_16329/g.24072  ORF Transcript_16329/g.24072 Transcript_16329/m.24072 type:complete len:576 (-) Transcript_16329:155-1882(-)|eukprot:CAMPEP_0116029362 /NCGR_PEP_ID=MMETSP0321-20121206/16098_1 /TAXON_ID=163516 /ORGANISM="Leptocylindrus danicus var. danicus, Strain B650" /LENGTH=575 /DNA_ID=CAMNT_0003503731 /DNA_START=176 /DNA_END=1903 /DNA_ORIENTATION=+
MSSTNPSNITNKTSTAALSKRLIKMQYVNHSYTDYSLVPEDVTDEQPFKGTLISSLGLKRVSAAGKKGGNFIDAKGAIVENKTPNHEDEYVKGGFKYLPCPPNRRHAGGVDKTFPQVLKNLLSCSEISHIVTWLPHGRSFIVQDTDEFVKSILPRFFRQSAFRSFSRQLQLWEFRRVVSKGPDFGSYYHELFLRGKPHLMMRMRRRKIKGTGAKLVPNPDEEPDFYALARIRPLPDLKSHKNSNFKLPALPDDNKAVASNATPIKSSTAAAANNHRENMDGLIDAVGGNNPKLIQEVNQGEDRKQAAKLAAPVTTTSMQMFQDPNKATMAANQQNNGNNLRINVNLKSTDIQHTVLQQHQQQIVSAPRPYPSAARVNIATAPLQQTPLAALNPQQHQHQHQQQPTLRAAEQAQTQYVMIPQQAVQGTTSTTAYAAPTAILLQQAPQQTRMMTQQIQPQPSMNTHMMNVNMNVISAQEEARIKEQLYARYMAERQVQVQAKQQCVQFAPQQQRQTQMAAAPQQYVLINVPQQQQSQHQAYQYGIVQSQQQLGNVNVNVTAKEEDAIAMLSSMQGRR